MAPDMRFAIFTDIHANREAFQAVLDDIAQRKIDRLVCLGDVVGYGPDPQWCVEKMADLVANLEEVKVHEKEARALLSKLDKAGKAG